MRMPQPVAGPVLVVEDDEVISMTVASLLREEGYAVVTAANGQAALECIARERPCLILLDMEMPVMDGWSFAAAYRQTPGPHAPILMLTAAHDAHHRAAEILADGVIDKPFDIDDLLQQVAEHASHG
jgi:two-component system, chemotaxis family, chemotaxis protein CheY